MRICDQARRCAGVEKFLRLNAKFAAVWPNIAKQPPD
jgi:Domain of unknown function (DUF3470)